MVVQRQALIKQVRESVKVENVNSENIKIKYLKEVLGIRQVLVSQAMSEKVVAPVNARHSLELLFDTQNPQSEVLFLSEKAALGIEELQLLEKIIVALKIPFQKTDIAYLNNSIEDKSQLIDFLSSKNYRFVFIQGQDLATHFSANSWFGNTFEFNGITFFTTFHPRDMIQNTDLKKEAWSFFKSIISKIQISQVGVK